MRELIEQRGGVDVSMEDLAKRAGVSRQTVYDQFGSRAGLLLALAEEVDRGLGPKTRYAGVLQADSAREALTHLLDAVAAANPGLVELARGFEQASFGDEQARSAWEDRMADRVDACALVARRLHEEGALREGMTVEEAADVIYALTSWQVWQLLVFKRGWSAAQWSSRTRMLLDNALTSRPGPN